MTLIMDLNAVRLLVRVAETRSFTRAAGDLGLTQSGLSRAISRLESELGVRLLQRNTRSVSLTPMGRCCTSAVHRCWRNWPKPRS